MVIHEEKVLLSADRLGRVAIVRRPDGLFCLYSRWRWSAEAQEAWGIQPVQDARWGTEYDPTLYYDPTLDIETSPLPGIYGLVEEAEAEARRLLGLNDREHASKTILLNGSTWQSPDDFFSPLLPRLGAPAWHGRNLNALDDSLYGGINELEPPFIVVVRGSEHVSATMTDFLAQVHEVFVNARRNYGVDVSFELN